jgi:hypothetical protein
MTDDELTLEALVDRAMPDTPPPFGDVLARRDRWRTRRRATMAGAAAVVAVTAIVTGTTLLRVDPGQSSDPAPAAPTADPTNAPTPETEPVEWDGEGVPPVSIQLADRIVMLDPWAYCYETACVDGIEPEDPEDMGSPDAVRFSFPLENWDFEATFTEAGDRCGRSITMPATPSSPRTFQLAPAGPAGDWKVSLFGRGEGGDVIVTFRWTTTTSGTVPEPSGSVSIVDDSGDETHVYAPELSLTDLAETPDRASALITVTAADGASRTLPTLRPSRGCHSEGDLFFNGPDRLTAGLADLGPFPYTYTVKLMMDGTTYTGTAVYPDDEIKDVEPYTALTFDPPLPAYQG